MSIVWTPLLINKLLPQSESVRIFSVKYNKWQRDKEDPDGMVRYSPDLKREKLINISNLQLFEIYGN